MAQMIISAIALGFIVAIPPGAVTIAVGQRALRFGFRKSLFFTIGSCMSDIFYLTIVYIGFAHILNDSLLFKFIFWIIGGGLLFYFAIDAIRSKIELEDLQTSESVRLSRRKEIISGIGITLVNPITVAGWIVIAGNFFTHWQSNWPDVRVHGITAIIFIMVGVLIWFVPLVFFISRLRKMLNQKALSILIFISSFSLAVFGIMAWWSAIQLVVN